MRVLTAATFASALTLAAIQVVRLNFHGHRGTVPPDTWPWWAGAAVALVLLGSMAVAFRIFNQQPEGPQDASAAPGDTPVVTWAGTLLTALSLPVVAFTGWSMFHVSARPWQIHEMKYFGLVAPLLALPFLLVGIGMVWHATEGWGRSPLTPRSDGGAATLGVALVLACWAAEVWWQNSGEAQAVVSFCSLQRAEDLACAVSSYWLAVALVVAITRKDGGVARASLCAVVLVAMRGKAHMVASFWASYGSKWGDLTAYLSYALLWDGLCVGALLCLWHITHRLGSRPDPTTDPPQTRRVEGHEP